MRESYTNMSSSYKSILVQRVFSGICKDPLQAFGIVGVYILSTNGDSKNRHGTIFLDTTPNIPNGTFPYSAPQNPIHGVNLRPLSKVPHLFRPNHHLKTSFIRLAGAHSPRTLPCLPPHHNILRCFLQLAPFLFIHLKCSRLKNGAVALALDI